MKIRNLLSREKFFEGLKRLGAVRFRISHTTLLQVSLLFLILVLAFTVRILPLRWGFFLSEFDPHYHYRITKHMVDNGILNWASGWSEADPSRDLMSWYPYGRNIATHTYPGLPATAAFFYIVLRALGLSPAPMITSHPLTVDPVFNLCVIFPAIMGTLACLVIYFLGKDIGGKEVGLFSALFLALNSSYISRTSLGFFDDETVGIFGILLFILFFLRSIEPERSLRKALAYAVAAGLSLGYIFASWGAARYPLGMIVLFVFILLLIRRYSSRLFLSYSVTFGLALFMAVNIPRLSLSFLMGLEVLAVSGMFMLLCMYEIFRHVRTPKMKSVFLFSFFAFLAVLILALSRYGYIGGLAIKWQIVINPFARFGGGLARQFVQSVAEHKPAAWGSFYYDLGIGAFFAPIGLFFAARNPTNRNIFICVFGLTAVYFAGSMVRLTLLLAPAFSLLWALALVLLIKPFITIMKETPAILSRKMRLQAHVGKEFSWAFISVMFLLLTFTFVLPGPGATFPRAISHAYSPTTLAAGSLPLKPGEPVTDWIDALNWMRVNLSATDVVAAWWDYGYWITTIANRTSLCDNGTMNGTQIATIGDMFLSNETRAIEILSRYDATYVVVFTTFQTDGTDIGWGDEGKWVWMARIAGYEYNETNHIVVGYQELIEAEDGTTSREWTEKGKQTVIYKLMTYGKEITLQASSSIVLEHFEEAYFSQKAGSPKNYGGAIPLVCVYKINYT